VQNNNPNNYLQEDEIDLKEIFKLLINSKKLIIVTTLIITLLGAIYSFQKPPVYQSTAVIEIGNYNIFSSSISFETKLIESLPTLINELNIQFIHKDGENEIIFEPVDQLHGSENRILIIKFQSTLLKKNTDLLNKIVLFIKNRHSNLQSNHTQKIENKLTNEIEKLNNLLRNIDSKINALNKVILETKNEANNLQVLSLFDYENMKYNLLQQMEALELDLEFLIKQKINKTQLVGEIVTKKTETKVKLILASFIFGLFLSVFIVFINNLLKPFKEK
jgi:capsular polysaccharide biosynthesis protein